MAARCRPNRRARIRLACRARSCIGAFSGEVGTGSPQKMRLLNGSVFPFIFAALKPGGRLLVAESIFDPHFVSRTKVRAQAAAAGFVEHAYAGNIFGYSLVFEKAAI